ncbi:cell wall hydrolase [Erythrobacteraceae bacterium CFH 75059]|uniref:cell wall hydrolase n=1 Tax=Qipengyuania thermophila TaxID=2509361 RepID=UPI001020F852|nr:cell wall hydrolase [Qipengyuania thermophila]TCD02229.1 cell wall hydrolase [Erythrobacteraceae bacterium CFH 75059]
MTLALRNDLPLYGVLLALAALFAVAVTLGRGDRALATAERTAGSAPADVAPALAPPLSPELAALPASAEDDAVILSQLPPDDARAQNARVPFAASWLAPAPAFRFRGSEADRVRARECLALAGMAEAGGGDADQRAVMQVILNRVRHPAFAPTVCGVVFQGSERATGCQFTFTCDGSLARIYSAAAWRAARQRADEMLAGAVYAPVGNATHYHTDWVFPWWSPKLDKIAQVRTHLFFRWRGHFGTTAAWTQRYSGGEPDPAALRLNAAAVERVDLTQLLAAGAAAGEGTLALAEEAAPSAAGGLRSPNPGVHYLLVGAGDRPAALLARGQALCAGEAACQVYGWNSAAAAPDTLPLSADARRQLRFSYAPGSTGRRETVFYDCAMFPAAPPGTCLPGTAAGTASAPTARRSRSETAPAATPSPEAESRLPQAGTLKVDAEPAGQLLR